MFWTIYHLHVSKLNVAEFWQANIGQAVVVVVVDVVVPQWSQRTGQKALIWGIVHIPYEKEVSHIEGCSLQRTVSHSLI